MLIKILHRTHYHYSQPVFLEPFTVMLRPRSDASQTVRHYHIKVTPQPSGITHFTGLYGNNTETIWFNGMHENLLIEVDTLVETHRGDPYDFFVTDPAALTLPLTYEPHIARVLAHYLIRDMDSPGVVAFTQEILQVTQHATLPFLALLAKQVYDRFKYVMREFGDPRTPEETLKAGEGSCRDFSVFFVDVCRSVGIAARFVSGYCIGTEIADSDMHAWVEIYLPGAGWRGYDPSRGALISDEYVAVAAGQRSQDAAPTFGSFRGEAESYLETSLSIDLVADDTPSA